MGLQIGVPVADDDAFQAALKKRERIREDLQRLQGELRDIEEFVSLYQRLFPATAGATLTVSDHVEGTVIRTRQRNILPPARLAELCREIISKAGRPMTRRELLDELQSQGIPLVGEDPSKNLGTILWRNRKVFQNVEGRGYWLRGVPLPPD